MFPPGQELLVGDLVFVADALDFPELAGLDPAQDGGAWFTGDPGDLGYPQVGLHGCK